MKYNSGPLSMVEPKGSRMPARADVPSIMVLTRRGSNWGSANTQVTASSRTWVAELQNTPGAR